jgi:hypothetical protein
MNRFVERDEREAGIDLAADRLAYLVVTYGLLLVVAYRAFVDRASSWELLGLVVLGGVVGVGYRAWHRSISGSWALVLGLTIAAGLVVAAITAFALRA